MGKQSENTGGMAGFDGDFGELAACVEAKLRPFSEQFQGVIVSVSGGVDSTALFHVFWHFYNLKKNFRLALFHFNFRLRAEHSDGDEAFCRQLAESRGLPFFNRRVNPKEKEARRGESVQEWARRLRYEALDEFIQEGWVVALAHHADDLAENVLLRLARGQEPGAISGMSSWNRGYWRPFLQQRKEVFERFLKAQGLDHRHDETNDTMDYSRNLIRNRVLPDLERVHSHAAEQLVRHARETAQWSAFLDQTLDRELDARAPELIPYLAGLPHAVALTAVAKAIGRLYPGAEKNLTRRGLESAWAHIRNNPHGSPGFHQELDRGHRLRIEGSRMWVEPVVSRQKSPRALQHKRGRRPQPGGALLEPGSYGFIKIGMAKLAMINENPPTSGLSPAKVRVYACPARKILPKETTHAERAYRLKRLWRDWSVSESERARYAAVEIDDKPVGIFDGHRVVAPDAEGNKKPCRQLAIDLGYW